MIAKVFCNTFFCNNTYVCIGSNWLGAGIFDKDPEYSMDNLMDFFNKMYYGDEYHFARKDFYYDQLPLTYSRDEFAIKGIMDTTHQCNIEITFCSADSE